METVNVLDLVAAMPGAASATLLAAALATAAHTGGEA